MVNCICLLLEKHACTEKFVCIYILFNNPYLWWIVSVCCLKNMLALKSLYIFIFCLIIHIYGELYLFAPWETGLHWKVCIYLYCLIIRIYGDLSWVLRCLKKITKNTCGQGAGWGGGGEKATVKISKKTQRKEMPCTCKGWESQMFGAVLVPIKQNTS